MAKTKKPASPAQLAARAKFAEARKAEAAQRKLEKQRLEDMQNATPAEPEAIPEEQIAPEQNESDLQRQVNELKAILFDFTQGNAAKPTQGTQHRSDGQLVGTFEKYTVDPANYPSPVDRLMKEPRLAPFAFEYNFEISYEIHISQYETKDGTNVKEPRFMVELRRVVLDGNGERTTGRYIVRKLTFHEDKQAAIQVARENGIDIDQYNELDFLNEMRYLRVRDWLLDIFYPPTFTASKAKKEMVVDNQVVEYIEVNGEDDQVIPFGELNKKSKLKA